MRKRLLLIALIFLLVFHYVPGTIPSASYALTETPFKLDIQVISEDPELCERVLGGSLRFQLPLIQPYVDFIFIQDASGSFTQTMPQVKETLRQMIANLDLGTEANGYPKDRAMLVTFQGSDGFGVSFSETDLENHFEYYSYFGYKITSTPLSTDPAILNAAINAISPLGATPTIDGLTRAQNEYLKAISPADNPYDRVSYENNEEMRNRQTVYFLITDGVANSGIYDNFPDGYKPLEAPPVGATGGVANAQRAWTWSYEARAKHYFELYWNPEESEESEFLYQDGEEQKHFRTFVDELGTRYYIKDPAGSYPTNFHTGPFFMYKPDSSGVPSVDTITYDPWENYPLMLGAMGAKAKEMKSVGGVPKVPGETGSAWFVSAYWEDINRFISGKLNGIMYRPEVRPLVYKHMVDMASNEDWYVSHAEGAPIAEFQKNLVDAFHDILGSQIRANLTFTLEPDVLLPETSLSLQREDSGEWTQVPLDGRIISSGEDLHLSLDKLSGGSYELLFELTEEVFKQFDYYPVTEVELSQIGHDEQVKSLMLNVEEKTVPIVEGNPNMDCIFTPPVETPTEPPEETPSEPPVETPSEPPAETPSEPPVETPSEPPVETPSEPPVETPSEPPVETPSEPPAETPSEPPAETPSEPPVKTPSEPVLPDTGEDPLLGTLLLVGGFILIGAGIFVLWKKKK